MKPKHCPFGHAGPHFRIKIPTDVGRDFPAWHCETCSMFFIERKTIYEEYKKNEEKTSRSTKGHVPISKDEHRGRLCKLVKDHAKSPSEAR